MTIVEQDTGHSDSQTSGCEPRDEAPLRFRWERAMRGAGLRPMLRVYLHNLASYMDGDGNDCFPAAEQLAADLDVKRGTVFDLQREAIEAGWLTVQRKAGVGRHGKGGTGLTNRYLPRIPSEQQQSGSHQTVAVESKETNRRVDTETNRRVDTRRNQPSTNQGETPYPLADIEDMLSASWGQGEKSTSRQRATQAARLVGMVTRAQDRWSPDDVRWLVTTNTSTAKTATALRWRIDRAEPFSPERARKDQALLGGLGQKKFHRSGGGRTPSTAGSREEFGDCSGALRNCCWSDPNEPHGNDCPDVSEAGEMLVVDGGSRCQY